MSTNTIQIKDLIDLKELRRIANEHCSRMKDISNTKLIQEREAHSNELEVLRAQERNKSIQRASLKQQEAKQRQALESSMKSLQTQREKVDELLKKKNEFLETKQNLESEINELKSLIHAREEALREANKKIDVQLASVPTQLADYEKYLGLRIDTADIRLIMFTFINIDPSDVDREFSFKLRLNGDESVIENTTPRLEDEVIKSLEEEFNSDSRFVEGLKKIRNSFRALV